MDNKFPSQSENSHEPSDERKLWFDYIKTLNERRLQSAQRSGVTVYGLIVVLAAILYKFVPQVPQFLATPGIVRVTIVTLGLGLPVVGWYFAAFASVLFYCLGAIENRATPESLERVALVLAVLAGGVGLLLAGFEILLVFAGTIFPVATRVLIVAYVVWLLANIGAPIWYLRKRWAGPLAKQIGLAIPRFLYWPRPHWKAAMGGAIVYFSLALWSTRVLIQQLRNSPVGWLQPLGAASIFCLVCVILIYMLVRSLRSITDGKCLDLERDILLEKLGPNEIKRAFLQYLAGPDMAQWFEGVLNDLREKDQILHSIYDEAQVKKNEISQINVEYVIERRSRAERLVERLQEGINQRSSHFDLLLSQVESFIRSPITPREKEVLARMIKELRIHHASDISTSANALCEEIKLLAK